MLDMLNPRTQDASHDRHTGPSPAASGGVARRRLVWFVLVFWIAYSGAVLGWHALTLPPAAACSVR